MYFLLVFLAFFLQASGYLQCVCPSGEEGCCTRISALLDCNVNIVHGNLDTCPHNYQHRPILWDPSEMDKYSECGARFRPDCSASITDQSRLAISAEAYSMSEAHLTVSWAHLQLNISEGSTIELRLYQSPYYSCAVRDYRCITEWSCISRYYCTQDLNKTSYIFDGAKFNFVNEVQFAVVKNSEVTTRIRTAFAERAEDFVCRSTNGIVPYDIEKCPPPRYGPVTSLRANITRKATRMDALVSWDPPDEDMIFKVALFYHVALYELDSDGLKIGSGSGALYFAVTPGPMNEGRILIRDLNCSGAYSIKVRVYVNCSACKERSWSSLILAFTPTPSPTSSMVSSTSMIEEVPMKTTVLTPTTIVPSATIVLTPTIVLPSATTVLILTAVIVSVILSVCVVVTAILCLVLHKKFLTRSERVFCEREPKVEKEMTTALSTTHENHQLDGRTSLGSDYHISSNGILPPTPSRQREHSWVPSSMLDECSSEVFYRRVLVVYSPYTAQGDIIRSLLVARLHSNYHELEVVCHDIVTMRQKPSCWLIDVVEKEEEKEVHAVLCVWTEEFKKDWRGESGEELDSDLVQALKMVITARCISTTRILKLATILLKPEDEDMLPVLLKIHPTFMIQDLEHIAAFVKGIPFYKLK